MNQQLDKASGSICLFSDGNKLYTLAYISRISILGVFNVIGFEVNRSNVYSLLVNVDSLVTQHENI